MFSVTFKMDVRLRRKLILCTLLVLMQEKTICAEVSDSNATAFDEVDAHILLKLGRQFNKPLLTLVGTAIRNLQACVQWSTWSSCSAIRQGYFGIKKRTRKCEINSHPPLEGKAESDFSVCTGHFPEDYNITANGFCMKLYTVKQNQEGAQKQCNDDGGHLVHMDSDLKYSDVAEFYKGYSSQLFVDGRRKDVKSAWIRSDGSPIDFFKWGDNDPDNGSNDLCLIVSTGNLLYDYACTPTRGFICEM